MRTRDTAKISRRTVVKPATILLAGAVAVSLWALYRMRRWQSIAGLSARFDDRMTERNRLASELQDIFLQSVQASKLLADQARDDKAADAPALQATMATLSDWLGEAITEGQSALNARRSSHALRNDLAEAFQRAAEVSGLTSAKEFVLSIEGAVRDVHPIVRDEVYRIGSEAIRAAYLHSRGHCLKLKITYSHDLILRITEEGSGLGQPFDLAKVQQRAARIGAHVRLFKRQGATAGIVLTVPGRAAYHGFHKLLNASEEHRILYE